jgi:exodeoxyribonuclease V alpha subunit
MDYVSGFDNEDKTSSQEQEQTQKPDSYYKDMIVKIKAKLQRVNFPKTRIMDEYGYAIVKLEVLEILSGEFHPRAFDYRKAISVKGEMSRLEAGEIYDFTIKLENVDPQWGANYMLTFCKSDFKFETKEQQSIFFEAFLTPNQITNLFETFDNPVEILKNGDTESLCKVHGVGQTTAEKMIQKYEKSINYAEAYVKLYEYDLNTSTINKLCQTYGSPNALVNIIKNNPYVLVEVDGYGFSKADTIALKTGIDPNSPTRIMAFIELILKDMGEQGNSWMDSSELLYKIEEQLGDIDMGIIIEAVTTLKELNKVWNAEKGKIGHMKFYTLELSIVKELYRLLSAPKQEIPKGWEDRVRQAEKLQGWEYTNEQKKAIETILNNNVSITTGHGGVGKSSTVLGAVKALGDVRFGQCALSGKASARLQEVTGHRSQTIHKLLGFQDKKFTVDRSNPLHHDVIILDEATMVNGSIFYSLIQSIPSGSKLIMIGDVNQLPPIGSLNVFFDCLDSGIIAGIKLTKIHRQAQKSAIITESIKIAQGIQLVEKDFLGTETRGELQDFHLDVYDQQWKTFDKVINTFKEKLEIAKDHAKVQVIVPFNMRGEISVFNINKALQKICNPEDPAKAERTITYGKNKLATLREGDLLMNTVNCYGINVYTEEVLREEKTDIFNGYIGELKKIKGDDLIVYFPIIEQEVVLPVKHWLVDKAIQHGWATTTHRYQGSQNDYVIVAIDSSHYIMLTSELLYTAVTRASKDCTLIAQNSALQTAIRTKSSTTKQTFMKEMLQKETKNI